MKKEAAAAGTKYYSYYYRQGDIILERIYQIPKQIINHQQQQQTQDNYIIAHGESGNQHRMSKHVLIFENSENKNEKERYVQVLSQDTYLVHQEHKSIHIPQGIYKIRREREYNAFESAIRQVQEVQD
jgi:hypothetical protein